MEYCAHDLACVVVLVYNYVLMMTVVTKCGLLSMCTHLLAHWNKSSSLSVCGQDLLLSAKDVCTKPFIVYPNSGEEYSKVE